MPESFDQQITRLREIVARNEPLTDASGRTDDSCEMIDMEDIRALAELLRRWDALDPRIFVTLSDYDRENIRECTCGPAFHEVSEIDGLHTKQDAETGQAIGHCTKCGASPVLVLFEDPVKASS